MLILLVEMNRSVKRVFLYIVFIFISNPCFGQLSWLPVPLDIYIEGNSKWDNNPLLTSPNIGIIQEVKEGNLMIPLINIEKSFNIILDQMGLGATVSLLTGPLAKDGGLESEVVIRYIYHFSGFTRQFDCFAEGGLGLGFNMDKSAVRNFLSLSEEDNINERNQLFQDQEFIEVTFSPHLALGLRVFIEDFFFTLKIVYSIISFDFSAELQGETGWTLEYLHFYISIGQAINLFD